MTQQGDRTSQVTVNLPELLTRVGNDRNLLSELIGIFKAEFPILLRKLQESVASEDMQRVEITSHTLKGMLLALSIKRAAAIASELEQMARAGESLGLADALTLMEREVANLLPELDEYAVEAQS